MNAEQHLERLGLLSWETVQVGLARGWMDRAGVESYAVKCLEKGNGDYRVAVLANSRNESQSDVCDTISSVIRAAGGEITDPWNTDSTPLRMWRLAHMLTALQEEQDEDKVEYLEQIYAEFGFPGDMAQCSRYYVEQHNEPNSLRNHVGPVDAAKHLVERLRAEFNPRR